MAGTTNGAQSDEVTATPTATPPAIPSLSISGGGAVTEGSDAVFTVMASASQSSSQTVIYILSDATGADFLDDTFLFPLNQTPYTLQIPTVGDSVAEQSGDITVTLRPRNGSNYVLGNPSSATVRVNDYDSSTPPHPSQ